MNDQEPDYYQNHQEQGGQQEQERTHLNNEQHHQTDQPPSTFQQSLEQAQQHQNHYQDQLLPSNKLTNRSTFRFNLSTIGWIVLAILFFNFVILHVWLGQTISEINKNASPFDLNSLISASSSSSSRSKNQSIISSISIDSIDQNDSIKSHLQLNLFVDIQKLLSSSSNKKIQPWSQSYLVGWFVNRSQKISIKIDSPITIYPIYQDLDPLINYQDNHHQDRQLKTTTRIHQQQQSTIDVHIEDPFDLPIFYPTKSNPYPSNSIPPINLNVTVKIVSPDQLAKLINHTLIDRNLRLNAAIKNLKVNINGDGFSSFFRPIIQRFSSIKLLDLKSQLGFQLPDLPLILKDPSKVIRIDSYSFYQLKTRNSSSLGLAATASIPNPILAVKKIVNQVGVNINLPWRFPLLIYLRQANESGEIDENLMVTALTVPFKLNDTATFLSVDIEGSLINSLVNQTDSGPLTNFLNTFLKGKPNNLTIRYDLNNYLGQQVTDHPGGIKQEKESDVFHSTHTNQFVLTQDLTSRGLQTMNTRPPRFIKRILSDLNLKIPFPGTNQTNFIKSLAIKDMKIDLSIRLKIFCSGTIEGILDLPLELRNVTRMINITEILPDVILLDGGLPPDMNQTRRVSSDPEYPANAFGRLKPADFIPATLTTMPNAQGTLETRLHASLDRIPLDVLEGRRPVLRSFITKYLASRNRSPGLLTSVIGSFDGFGSIDDRFSIRFDQIGFFGSFYL